MTTLRTARLTLRPWRDDDVAAWAAMSQDPRVAEFFPPRSPEQHVRDAALLRARLEANGYGWWVLEANHVAPFAGIIALQMVPDDLVFAPAMEVGWRLRSEYWGRGYATEGARAALRYGFDVLRQPEIVAMTAAVNLRSQRVMERLGMQRDAAADFDHPRVAEGDRLRPHVLYRLRADAFANGSP